MCDAPIPKRLSYFPSFSWARLHAFWKDSSWKWMKSILISYCKIVYKSMKWYVTTPSLILTRARKIRIYNIFYITSPSLSRTTDSVSSMTKCAYFVLTSDAYIRNKKWNTVQRHCKFDRLDRGFKKQFCWKTIKAHLYNCCTAIINDKGYKTQTI